ncbi:hypothetical protein [Aureivirga sp. CE67]|uniref:hypothetical protein n=1 Tax=Aureivirga sp. CE67 TaxID=1788983 RepID=UPI0018C94E1E|nr:hypothetical protein [Aureivirga sp. CE67]
MKYKFVIFFLLIQFYSYTQTGPGGIGTIDGSSNMKLWLDANHSVYKDSGNTPAINNDGIMQWNDLSGNNNHAILIDSNNKPEYQESSINGNSSLFFNNNDVMISNFIPATGSNPRTLVCVASNLENNPDKSHRHLLHYGNYQYKRAYGIAYKTPLSAEYTSEGIGNHYWASGISSDITFSNDPMLFLTRYNGATDFVEINGKIEASKTINLDSGTHRNLLIGSRVSYFLNTITETLIGNMGEIIVFDNDLSLSKRIILSNYLSGKYGFPLTEHDYYTMDNDEKGNIDYHIIGIGKASDGTEHLNSIGTGIIQINNPSDLDNDEFIFIGVNNKENNNLQFQLSNFGYSERLNRIWAVNKHNDLGSIDLIINLNDTTIPSVDLTCERFKLVTSNTIDFQQKNSYDLEPIPNTNSYKVSNIDFNDAEYFSLEVSRYIGWNGYAFENGLGIQEIPTMADYCMKMIIDSSNPNSYTAILPESANVKSLEIKTNNTLVIPDGKILYVEDEIILNGDIRLIGDAQLIQKHSGETKVSGNGKLYRERIYDQNSKYTLKYLSSPVFNANFMHTVKDILFVGGDYSLTNYGGYQGVTANSTHDPYTYVSGFDDASVTPLLLSDYWFWKFINGNSYDNWQFIRDLNINVNRGEGFSIKGTGRSEKFTFIGTPNDGIITSHIDTGNESLLGNPYPSALDSNKFITDNLNSISGTLYLWDQSAATGHSLNSYEGGYASINLLTSVKAVHIVSGNSLNNAKTPSRYLPVCQGFFVESSTSGGEITFNNQQRIHKIENNNESIFLRKDVGLLKLNFGYELDNNQYFQREIAIGMSDDFTSNFDKGYDSKVFDSRETDISLVNNNSKEDLVIIAESSDTERIQLKIKTDESRFLELNISEKENFNYNIYLYDNQENKTYRISSSKIDFFVEKGEYSNRFEILINSTEKESNFLIN